jgi:hypothetical protein
VRLKGVGGGNFSQATALTSHDQPEQRPGDWSGDPRSLPLAVLVDADTRTRFFRAAGGHYHCSGEMLLLECYDEAQIAIRRMIANTAFELRWPELRTYETSIQK